MSAKEIRKIAEEALNQIALTLPGYVFASRKGIVAGAIIGRQEVVFRREKGVVHLEVDTRDYRKQRSFDPFPLPPDLESRAARMLDTL